jgi:hypothetical protein
MHKLLDVRALILFKDVWIFTFYKQKQNIFAGRDSSVGIATRYVLDGPGIETRCERFFPHPSRPALRPKQLPIQWVPDLSLV